MNPGIGGSLPQAGAPIPFHIDPALIPLPGGGDRDLYDPRAIAEAVGHSASVKVAGSRRKTKTKPDDNPLAGTSKRKALADLDPDSVDKPAKRGRPSGAGNYSDDDIASLLDFVEAELPLGHRGWNRVHSSFNKWARRHDRPDRLLKSLETKFKQV